MPEFEAWMVETGNTLTYWHQSFLERLADHTINAGNLSEALYWLWQAIQIDPLKTELHYTALTCLRDSGKTNKIVNYLEQLKKIYTVDHGLEVPPVLTEFVARSLEAKEKFAAHFSGSGENQSEPQPPFVGRKEILQQLNLWSQRGGIIYLKGESGIGKSRLLQEFYNRVDFPIRSVFCNAQPTQQNLPFQPFIDGLRTAARGEDWRSLSPAQAEVLTLLFPEIAENRTDIPEDSQVSFQESFQAIFDAIHALLVNMMAQKHLVVFFDDAHWGDEASISLLGYLCSRGLFQANGVLIISTRIEEQNKPLQQLIQSVERRSNFKSVQLEYLNDKEVGELVYSVLGKLPPPEMIARLMREVGGNPLFLHQTLKLVMDYSTNIDTLAVLKTYPIPHEVQAVIQERLSSLDPEARSVANICAVIGPSFTPGLVEDVSSLDQSRVVQILEQLVNMHFFNEARDVKPTGGYAFAHEKIRDSILSDLGPARTRLLNLQVVAALQKRYGKPLSLATRYAQYYEQAGELKLAFEEWIHAGRYARQLYSKPDAYFAYKKAFDLMKQNEELFGTREIHEVVTKWGNYAYDIRDKETSEFIYQSCLEIGTQRQNPLLIGTGQSGLARLMGMRDQIPSALRRMQLALKSLEASDWTGELIEAYTRQGNLFHLSSHYLQARESYEKALSLEVNDEAGMVAEARINAQALLSILYSEMGLPAKALVLANQSLESSQVVHRITSRIQAYAARAIALFYTGNYRDAIETGQFVMPEIDAKGMPFWSSLLNGVLAGSYLSAGYLDKAWTHVEEAFRQSQRAATPFFESRVHTIRGEIFRYLHFYDEAEQELAIGAGEKDFDSVALESLYKLGVVKIERGELEQGLAMVERALIQSSKVDLSMVTLPARATKLISSCTRSGKIEDHAEYQRLIEEANERGFMPLPLWLEWVRFTIDHPERLGDSELAELERLLKAIHGCGNIWLEVETQLYVVKSKSIPEEFKPRARQHLITICDMLYEHALQEPVCGMVKEFAGGIEKVINSVGE